MLAVFNCSYKIYAVEEPTILTRLIAQYILNSKLKVEPKCASLRKFFGVLYTNYNYAYLPICNNF